MTQWHDRVRSSLHVDDRLAKWWSEVSRKWGISPRELDLRPHTNPSSSSSTAPGLHSTSRIGTALSGSSSFTLATPAVAFDRFPQYPPSVIQDPSHGVDQSSRSTTITSHPSLISPTSEQNDRSVSYMDPKADIKLPPLPSSDLLRYGIDRSKTGYFDLPRDRDRLSTSLLDRPKTSPIFDPYEGVRGKAPAPPTIGPLDVKERVPSNTTKPGKGSATGIAALLSATDEE